MSTWIRVTDWITCAVAVQVQCFRLRSASAVGVLCQEAAVFRAVVAGVEIVETCRLVVNSTAVADLVIEIILTLLDGFTVVRVAVGLLRSSVLANDVDGALTQILGIGVELYRIAFSRSCRREDVVLRADQVETADRIILILRVQDCRSVVKIFSCIRAFLFLDSLSKSIILVLLGIINQSAYLHVFCKVPSRGYLTGKAFDNAKLLLFLGKMTAEEILPSFPCSHITLLLSPKFYFINVFSSAFNSCISFSSSTLSIGKSGIIEK